MAASAVHDLRQVLERRFGAAILPLPGTGSPRLRPVLRTGLLPLDRLLGGGVPRGEISLWTGPAGSGRTALLHALVRNALAEQRRVGVIDAGRTLAASSWDADPAERDLLWIARAPDCAHTADGPWVAEAMLRAGIFDLVVLDGAEPDGPAAHRLRLLAEDRDAALLISTPQAGGGWRADRSLAFSAESGPALLPGGRVRRRVRVELLKGERGRAGTAEIEIVDEPPRCLHPHSAPDRSTGRA